MDNSIQLPSDIFGIISQQLDQFDDISALKSCSKTLHNHPVINEWYELIWTVLDDEYQAEIDACVAMVDEERWTIEEDEEQYGYMYNNDFF